MNPEIRQEVPGATVEQTSESEVHQELAGVFARVLAQAGALQLVQPPRRSSRFLQGV